MCRRTGGFRPQFLPSLAGISLLCSRVLPAASLWVHILAINLFAARAAYLQGEADPASSCIAAQRTSACRGEFVVLGSKAQIPEQT